MGLSQVRGPELSTFAPADRLKYVTGFYQGATWSVQCYEALRVGPSPAEIMPNVPAYLLNYAITQPESSPRLVDLCRIWGVPVADEIEARPVSSETPVPLLSGTLDLLTPPTEAERAAETLPRSIVVVLPAAQGEPIRIDCGRSIARAFLADPAQTPDTSCAAAMVSSQ